MATRVIISAATPLGFGSYIQVAIEVTVNGVLESSRFYSFDANYFSIQYDLQNMNIAVFHFNGHAESVSNGQYTEFYFALASKSSPVALAQSVIADIAQYTT